MAKAEDAAAEDGEAGGGGGKKKLIIIVAIVLVLLIGGGAAAFFLLSGEEAAEGETAAAQEAEEPPGEPTYHEMSPKFVVNLPPGGKARMMQLSVQVFTTKSSIVEFLQKHDPMLRHHVFDVLSSADGDSLYTRAGREALQAQLKSELEKKMQENGLEKAAIDGVYFTEFVLQ